MGSYLPLVKVISREQKANPLYQRCVYSQHVIFSIRLNIYLVLQFHLFIKLQQLKFEVPQISYNCIYLSMIQTQDHFLLKKKIIEALSSLTDTFLEGQSEVVQAKTFLAQQEKTPGFSMLLIQIVNEATSSELLIQSALIQLKRTVLRYWNYRALEMKAAQKQKIRQNIFTMMIKFSSNHAVIKSYKQIAARIVGYDYKTWMPTQQILTKLRADQDVVAMLHYAIAIAKAFQFSINNEQRSHFYQFLIIVSPELNSVRQRSKCPQVIYLLTKFIWKVVHYQINDQVKILMLDWMDLLTFNVGLVNPTYDNNITEPQIKGTPQFYYFHTKKWSTRILLRFFQRHVSLRFNQRRQRENNNNQNYQSNWYTNFGQKFIEIIVAQFHIKTTNKVRFFQLKCINSLITEKPDQLMKFSKLFQQQILLEYLKLKPQDEQRAQNHPNQFIKNDSQPAIYQGSLRRVATDVWIAFAQLGNQQLLRNPNHQAGLFFEDNIIYLKDLFLKDNLLQKEMVMYLLCQLHQLIRKCGYVKFQILHLISNHMLGQLSNEVTLLRARALDLFFTYGSDQDLSFTTILRATQSIYKCLAKEVYPIVRIKAASALTSMIKHNNAKQFVRPLIKDILNSNIQLIETYGLKSLADSLQNFTKEFSNEIVPFAYDLTKTLTDLFKKLYQKDFQESNKSEEYDGEAELVAVECLVVITQIINACILLQAIMSIQKQVVQLCEFIFTSQKNAYLQEILKLLSSYLRKSNMISSQLFVFYQVIIYKIVDIPNLSKIRIPELLVSQAQRKILSNIKCQNFDLVDKSFSALKQYIIKGFNILTNKEGIFDDNLMQLLFHMIQQVYTRNNQFYEEINKVYCTYLLIILIQNHKNFVPQNLYQQILQICKLNIWQRPSFKKLKIMSSQLLLLMTWVNPSLILQFVQKQEIQERFISDLFQCSRKCRDKNRQRRIILGLSSLIKYPLKPQFIQTVIDKAFKISMKLVKQNFPQLDQQQQQLFEPDPDSDAYSEGSNDLEFEN